MNVEVIAADESVTLRPDDSGRQFRVLDEFVVLCNIDRRGVVVKVPAGFDTDLASVPRVLWSWMPPTGRYLRAAIVHDWLYKTATMPRKTADRIFHALMIRFGVGPARARLMYSAVRVGGRGAWE